MSWLPLGDKDYSDGRTKQSFKDSTDINKILKKAQKHGSLAHIQKYDKAVYGEFTGLDLLTAHNQISRAQEIFDDLPSEVRSEFGHDALSFAGFASDPANIDRLDQLIPDIARPGSYFPNPVKRAEAAVEPPAVPAASSKPDVAPAAREGAVEPVASSST